MVTRLAWKSHRSACLCLLSAGAFPAYSSCLQRTIIQGCISLRGDHCSEEALKKEALPAFLLLMEHSEEDVNPVTGGCFCFSLLPSPPGREGCLQGSAVSRVSSGCRPPLPCPEPSGAGEKMKKKWMRFQPGMGLAFPEFHLLPEYNLM